MKKLLLLFVLCSVIVSCGSTRSLYSDTYWHEREIPPSELKDYSNVWGRFSDGTKYRLIDPIGVEDSEYYYELLMKEFGWVRNIDGGFSSNDGRRTNRGSLYVSSKRGIAIYFHPEDGNYLVYKAEIVY